MFKLVRGKKSKEFGEVEWLLTLNWGNLLVALLVAFLGWVGTDAIPVLQENGVLSAGVLAFLVMVVHWLQNYFKDNTKINYEKPIK